ncbi:protein HESO1 isoform X2 [Diospyros lotus]|uniref:protein HESO1 isoform X2 n=1 Tax=Diospyros lotus TaxID=55363 RepID=UPI00225B9AA5|nr:protein HESO1 isoform X2 [Diospyros lotus]
MSSDNSLEFTLRDILAAINPTGDDWSARLRLIEELRVVVRSLESLRGATVEPYGSFASNLFTRWGDLDVSIELPNGSYISMSFGKKHKQTLLQDVLKSLRRRGGWQKLQFIANARVPILKCKSSYLNISCDISINNLNGQMKSKLLFWINEIDRRFRDMVKEWAKAHDINDSKSGTFNSYCLSLLVIFHFQTCTPAILPPLQEIYPRNMVDDLRGVRADAEKNIEETCAENIYRFRSDKSRMRNYSSLSELFISFLAKFSDISSRAPEQGISPCSGQWENIETNTRWQPKTYALFVEDPFEQPANTARTVNQRNLSRISETFQTTHQMLISGNQDYNSVLATLVGPQVSQFLQRRPVHNPRPRAYISQNSRARPQTDRAVNLSMQGQNQFQNARVDRRPNTNGATMQRTVNAAQNQVQQVWRPRSDR